MVRPGEIYFEKEFTLTRPKILAAQAWVNDRIAADGMIDRKSFEPKDLKPFMSYVSLFTMIVHDDKVTDFVIRVVSSAIATHFGESSGKLGSEALPAYLFDRWLQMAQFVYDAKKPICVRSRVQEDQSKVMETLVVPVTVDGKLEQALSFSEFWYEQEPMAF